MKEALDNMRGTYESRVPAAIREQKDYLGEAIKSLISKKRKELGLE
jgi:hypothetical protein